MTPAQERAAAVIKRWEAAYRAVHGESGARAVYYSGWVTVASGGNSLTFGMKYRVSQIEAMAENLERRRAISEGKDT